MTLSAANGQSDTVRMEPRDDPEDLDATREGETRDAATGEPSPKPEGLVFTILLGLAAPLVTALVATLLVLGVACFMPDAPRGRSLVPWALRSAMGVATLLLLQKALVVLWAWRLAKGRAAHPRRWLRITPFRFSPIEVLMLVLLAWGVLGAGGLAAWISHQLGVPSYTSAVMRVEEILRTAPGVTWILLVIAMGLGPGIGEEVWCRGYVLRALQSRFRPRLAILVSALMFSALHLDPSHIVFAMPFGLVFGWLTVRTGSILPESSATHLSTRAST